MPEVLPLYDRKGNPIPANQLADAVKAREAFVPEGGKVGMVTPAGKFVAVPAADYERALGSGLVPEAYESQRARVLEAKHGGLGEQILTGLEGAARSVPIVPVQGLLNAAGGEGYRQRAEARAETNPGSALVGELGGLAAQMAAETALTGGLAAPAAAAEGAQALRVGLRGAQALEEASAATRALRGIAATVSGPQRAVSAAGRAVGGLVEGWGATRTERVLEAAREAGVATSPKLLRALESGGDDAALALRRLVERAGPEAGQAIQRAATEAPLLSRLASTATQGAIYGGSQELADTALHGRDITAERMVHAMGTGAMFGVGADLTLAAGSRALRRMLQRGEGEGEGWLSRKLGEVADERAMSATGVTGAQKRKLASSGRPEDIAVRANELGRELRTYRLANGDPVLGRTARPEDLAETIPQALHEVGAKFQQQAATVERAIAAHPEAAPNAAEMLGRIQREVIAPLRQELSGDAQAAARHVEAEFEQLLGRVAEDQPVSWAELQKLKQRIGDKVYNEGTGIGLPAPVKMANKPLQQAQRIVAETVNGSAEAGLRAAGEDPSAWRAINAQMGRWLDLRKIIRSSAPPGGARSLSLTDNMHGAAAGLGALLSGHFGVAALAGVGSAIGHKMLRERGSALAADLAGRLSTLTRRANTATAAIAGVKTRGTVSRALPMVAAVTGSAPSAERLTYSQDEINQRIKQVQETARLSDDEQLHRATQSLGQFAQQYPDAASAAAIVALNKQAYLASKLPKPRGTLSATPQASKPVVPAIEQERFGRILHAMDDPEGVLEDVGKGKVDPDAIEALEQTSPAWFDEQRQAVLAHLAERKEPLPTYQAIAIGRAFGIYTEPEMEPATALAAQQTFTELAKVADQQQRPMKDTVGTAGRATAAQQLEGKGRTT